jgi:uncharacterized membrane protein YgcG
VRRGGGTPWPWPSLVSALLLAVALVAAVAPLTLAQAEGFGQRAEGQHIADTARVIDDTTEEAVAEELAGLLEATGIDIVVYTQAKAQAGNRREAREEAAALLEAWGVGGETGTGAVMLWNINEARTAARPGVALGSAWSEAELTAIDDALG